MIEISKYYVDSNTEMQSLGAKIISHFKAGLRSMRYFDIIPTENMLKILFNDLMRLQDDESNSCTIKEVKENDSEYSWTVTFVYKNEEFTKHIEI